MAQQKEVSFDQKLSGEQSHDHITPAVVPVTQADQLGLSAEALNRKNVRELGKAVSGIHEFYVATSSGGAVTTKLTFQDGILITIT